VLCCAGCSRTAVAEHTMIWPALCCLGFGNAHDPCASLVHWAGLYQRNFIGVQSYERKPAGEGPHQVHFESLSSNDAVLQRLTCGKGNPATSYQLEKNGLGLRAVDEVSERDGYASDFDGVVDATCEVTPWNHDRMRCTELHEPAWMEFRATKIGEDCAVKEFVAMYQEYGAQCKEGGPNSGLGGCHTCTLSERVVRVDDGKAHRC